MKDSKGKEIKAGDRVLVYGFGTGSIDRVGVLQTGMCSIDMDGGSRMLMTPDKLEVLT